MKLASCASIFMLICAVSACSDVQKSSESKELSTVAPNRKNAIEIASIKSEIRALTHANAGNKNTKDRVRALLDSRLAALKTLQGPVTEAEKLNRSVGVWNQLWSDEENPQVIQPPGVTNVESQVYQVILDDNTGYNFGLRNGPFGEGLFIIRFDVTDGTDSKVVTFTNTYFRQGKFAYGENLVQLAKNIGAGTAANVVERQAPKFPRGPIGSQSPLFTDYIDVDFRIVTVPNSVTKHLDMFVLEKTYTPIFDLSYQDVRRKAETSRLKKDLSLNVTALAASNDSSPNAAALVKSKVELLSLISPPPVIGEQFKSLVGAWRLLWSNENVVSDRGPKPEKVYQIISPSSRIYNLGERKTPTGSVVFSITTPVTLQEDGFFIQFDGAFLRNTPFTKDESLSKIGLALETDPALAGFVKREAGKFPNGPIGATDLIKNLFLDDSLRVTKGTNASTGTEEIFVLEKADFVR